MFGVLSFVSMEAGNAPAWLVFGALVAPWRSIQKYQLKILSWYTLTFRNFFKKNLHISKIVRILHSVLKPIKMKKNLENAASAAKGAKGANTEISTNVTSPETSSTSEEVVPAGLPEDAVSEKLDTALNVCHNLSNGFSYILVSSETGVGSGKKTVYKGIVTTPDGEEKEFNGAVDALRRAVKMQKESSGIRRGVSTRILSEAEIAEIAAKEAGKIADGLQNLNTRLTAYGIPALALETNVVDVITKALTARAAEARKRKEEAEAAAAKKAADRDLMAKSRKGLQNLTADELQALQAMLAAQLAALNASTAK